MQHDNINCDSYKLATGTRQTFSIQALHYNDTTQYSAYSARLYCDVCYSVLHGTEQSCNTDIVVDNMELTLAMGYH